MWWTVKLFLTNNVGVLLKIAAVLLSAYLAIDQAADWRDRAIERYTAELKLEHERAIRKAKEDERAAWQAWFQDETQRADLQLEELETALAAAQSNRKTTVKYITKRVPAPAIEKPTQLNGECNATIDQLTSRYAAYLNARLERLWMLSTAEKAAD